jgi:hypothetical protein
MAAPRARTLRAPVSLVKTQNGAIRALSRQSQFRSSSTFMVHKENLAKIPVLGKNSEGFTASLIVLY